MTPFSALLLDMPYDGGKSQSGVWQRIINLIPPHDLFVELFAGSAAIARLKKPAARTILVEKDVEVMPDLASSGGVVKIVRGCGIEFAEKFAWPSSAFVYADPPYVLSTRGGRRYYRHELTDADHQRLIQVLRGLPCRVMISGYSCDLYERGFHDWNYERFDVMKRGRSWRTECLWFNYPRPEVLHDLRRVGEDRRERWRIEKRRRNWRARMLRASPLERAALFSALVDVMGRGAVDAILGDACRNFQPPLTYGDENAGYQEAEFRRQRVTAFSPGPPGSGDRFGSLGTI